jgi:hypothetical protein
MGWKICEKIWLYKRRGCKKSAKSQFFLMGYFETCKNPEGPMFMWEIHYFLPYNEAEGRLQTGHILQTCCLLAPRYLCFSKQICNQYLSKDNPLLNNKNIHTVLYIVYYNVYKEGLLSRFCFKKMRSFKILHIGSGVLFVILQLASTKLIGSLVLRSHQITCFKHWSS